MKKLFLAALPFISLSTSALIFEAKVTEVLQHDNYVAVYLSPDPGKSDCEFGQPYLLPVDDTAASQQKYSLILTALTAGKTVKGYFSSTDVCSTAIWSQSRPVIRRIAIKAD